MYTIGQEILYDSLLCQNNLVKSKGGHVWKDFDSVQNYFYEINGMVEVDGKKTKAAIYECCLKYIPNVTVDGKIFGRLLMDAKIFRKIDN